MIENSSEVLLLGIPYIQIVELGVVKSRRIWRLF